jgi:catalase
VLDGPETERERDGDILVFDPTRVTGGIELSDDSILRFRPRAYSASIARREATKSGASST